MKDKLVSLRDKLNNISRSNRSIRLMKLYNKWNFDLHEVHKVSLVPDQLLNGLLQNNSETILSEKQNDTESLNLSKKLTTLYRNINSIEEETGLYDVYLGYPFVEGCMADGTYIRAPLFLYPIKLNRIKKANIQWEANPVADEDPQINRTLFLALQKLNNMYFSDDFFEKAEGSAKEGDIDNWITWLQDFNINVSSNNTAELEPLKSYRKEDIPEFPPNSFRLNHQAVIGHFPQGDSAILKDYNEFIDMLEEGDGLGVVKEFLNIESSDPLYETDSLATNVENQTLAMEKEKSKYLVLDADASQEGIIEELENEKGLVVQGPPGTGKSQVIVNMITNAMAKGKKVMLVTQKRAALDVVYQRLDAVNLSANVALLHDEKNDRKKLYQKISSQINRTDFYEDITKAHEELSEQIVKTEEEMNQVTNALFTPQDHGYRAYDLYGLSKSYKEQETILDLKKVLPTINKHNLEDILNDVGTYADYYETFSGNDNPVSDRKPFHKTEIADRMKLIEILENIINYSEEAIQFLDHFEEEAITPAYSQEIDSKLEKIYDDLNSNEQKTFQKFRLWLWTSFTGKTIVEELLDGEKFKGLSSREWPELRESLTVLYELSQKTQELFIKLDELSNYFQDEAIKNFKKRISKGDIPLKEFSLKQEYIKEHFDRIREMDYFYQSRDKTVQHIIDSSIKSAPEKNRSLSELWRETVKQSIYIQWIDQLEAKYPELADIGNNKYTHNQQKLNKLLAKKQDLTIKLIQNQIEQSVSDIKQKHRKAVSDMNHQTNKKRRIWKVRKFVNEFSLNGLLDITPVWLVSPEVASAIFPLKEKLFDLVIFDEASQCTVENGIPAIYRGDKIVIAGDEQQLPPSSLFRSSVELDEDEEIDEFEESQSVLNLAKRILPDKLLEWHYRSKSEELINFSNHAFYNGYMQIAPNVNHLQKPPAIQWHQSDGRWINQQNTVEAEDVVKLLKTLLIRDHKKTVGIITFNAKQQEAIIDLIEKYADEDSEFSAVYEEVMGSDLDERIFVKNIENVQGDERDTIIFSIGYAKNDEGKVINRFGTLNQQGGENRLNVAVTRAKEGIHIVSSITPNELNVTNTKNLGPKLLKHYMTYAYEVSKLNKEKIENVLSEINTDRNTNIQQKAVHFDSPFEEQVYNRLRHIGYKVDTQIGMSGYRIDLAVVDPNDASKYILGIECDGAMYHSAPSARERDIYRQRFLESKGWRIERIWSRNWWKDPNSELERIDRLIKSLSKRPALKANA